MVMDDPFIACADEWNYLADEYHKTKELREKHQRMSIEFYNIQQKCKG